MNGFLSELSKQLAQRWVALLVLPGLLFTAAATASALLGQRHWADVGGLSRRAGQLASTMDGPSDGLPRTALLLVVLLVASLASGLLAHALATPVEHALAGRWPAPFRRLARACARRRARAWARADQDCKRARDDAAPSLGALTERRNHIALIKPVSATWIGDRLAAPLVRVRKEYGIDLAFGWPRLWLLLPESTRAPLTESRRRLDEAATLGGWALLYGALGAVWWPCVIIGVAVGLVCWRRCRTAADVYAGLVEAAVDVHLDELLALFTDDQGVRPARPHWGKQITERFRKGV